MSQYSFHLRLGESGLKEGGPLALRKARMARPAVQQPQALVLAVAHTHRQIAYAAFAVGSTGRILTAKSREILHGCSSASLAFLVGTSLPLGPLWQTSFSSSITTGHHPEFWMNLQKIYELDLARKEAGEAIKHIPQRPKAEAPAFNRT